jgi:tetratricopeptide (TPR) repeat protein
MHRAAGLAAWVLGAVLAASAAGQVDLSPLREAAEFQQLIRQRAALLEQFNAAIQQSRNEDALALAMRIAPLERRALEIADRLLGDDEPELVGKLRATYLDTQAWLLQQHETRHEYAQALAAAKELAAHSAKHLGGDHWQSRTYRALVAFYERVSRFTPQQRDEMQRMEVQHAAALQHSRAGRHAEAVGILELLLPQARALDGDDGLRAAVLSEDLAVVLRELGRYDEARRYLDECLALRLRRLGETHPAVATAALALAATHLELGNLHAARQQGERAVRIRRATCGAGDPELATALNVLGVILNRSGQYRQAIECLEEALAVRRKADGPRSRLVAVVLNNLALAYREQGQLARAMEMLQQVADIDRDTLPADDPQRATVLNNLGQVAMELGNYELARAALDEGLALLQRAGASPRAAWPLRINLTQLWYYQGKYEPAENELSRLLAEVRGTGQPSPESVVIILNNRGMVRFELDGLAAAHADLLEALELATKHLPPAHGQFARTLNNLALVAQRGGDFGTARDYYQRALAVQRAALPDDHYELARLLGNIALLDFQLGNYESSQQLLEQALPIVERTLATNHVDYARLLNNYALVAAYGLHDHATAGELLQRAHASLSQAVGPLHPETILAWMNRGFVYQMAGNYDEAIEYLQRAADDMQRALGPRHYRVGVALNNVGMVHLDAGNPAAARQPLERALEILGSPHLRETPEFANALLNLAMVDAAQGKVDAALVRFEEGLRAEQRAMRAVFRFSSEAQMRAYVASLGRSLDGLVSVAASDPRSSTRRLVLAWTLRRKALVAESLCRFREAQRLLADRPELARSAAQLRRQQQQMTDLVLNPPREASSREVQQRIEDLRRSCDALESQLNAAMHRRGSASGAGVADAAEGDEAGLVQPQAVAGALPQGSALVEFVLAVGMDFRARGADRFTPPRYYALVLPADPLQEVALVDLGPAETLDKLVDEFRAAIRFSVRQYARTAPDELPQQERAWEEEFRLVARPLYERLVAPLRPALADATTLYVAPDGELNRVPLEALVDAEGKYLIERYRIAYLTSGRDLLRVRRPAARGTVVFAGPDYDLGVPARAAELAALDEVAGSAATLLTLRGGVSADIRGMRWRVLPAAAEEAQDVHDALHESPYGPVEVYQGRRALEEVFKGLRAPGILHVATHGFFLANQQHDIDRGTAPPAEGLAFGQARGFARLRGAENPLLRSGLVLCGANAVGEAAGGALLEDGWLTAQEIALLDLRGTHLVVLSACESGLGDVAVGEGVQGLRLAFQYAGAGTLVSSLFQVPDRETRQLMQRFYAHLKSGRSKLEALRDAQLEVIRNRRGDTGAAHPMFWGSFVLVGQPE